jgi:hypothetical protein
MEVDGGPSRPRAQQQLARPNGQDGLPKPLRYPGESQFSHIGCGFGVVLRENPIRHMIPSHRRQMPAGENAVKATPAARDFAI